MNEIHPYNTRLTIPAQTRTLIVGTAPPERFSNPKGERYQDDIDFYYGSRDNQLWRDILPAVLDNFPSFSSNAIEHLNLLKAYLETNGIWCYDIFDEYSRSGKSALDDNLIPIKSGSVGQAILANKQINRIILTGGTTEKMFFQHFKHPSPKGNMPRHSQVRLFEGDDRNFTVWTVASPSPSAERSYPLTDRIDMYRAALADKLIA